MSTKTIYDALVAAGMTREGAASVIGNWLAESGCEAYRLENDLAESRAKSHAYVRDVMSGAIHRHQFSQDRKGFGLAQWTYPTRKAALYDFLQARGAPLDDEAAQVQFALHEMRTQPEYAKVWAVLTASHDLLQCTQTVCVSYEQPAVNNVGTRYEYAQQFMAEFGNGSEFPNSSTAPATQEQQSDVILLQLAMQQDGYWDKPIDGLNTADWREAFRAFAGDVLGVDIK